MFQQEAPLQQLGFSLRGPLWDHKHPRRTSLNCQVEILISCRKQNGLPWASTEGKDFRSAGGVFPFATTCICGSFASREIMPHRIIATFLGETAQ